VWPPQTFYLRLTNMQMFACQRFDLNESWHVDGPQSFQGWFARLFECTDHPDPQDLATNNHLLNKNRVDFRHCVVLRQFWGITQIEIESLSF
jgi:hypothetical protein